MGHTNIMWDTLSNPLFLYIYIYIYIYIKANYFFKIHFLGINEAWLQIVVSMNIFHRIKFPFLKRLFAYSHEKAHRDP